MRFGAFVFSIGSDPNRDHEVLQQTMREVELAEEVGMDAICLAEHHFNGAVACADPLVFGEAVAMRSMRVEIGFAVVEMALHHPVRFAVQTALLGQHSDGHPIVGFGEGFAYNEYEYIGYGLTIQDGFDCVEEAAELRDAGVRNLLLNVNVGQIPAGQVESSMRLFGDKVLPKFN